MSSAEGMRFWNNLCAQWFQRGVLDGELQKGGLSRSVVFIQVPRVPVWAGGAYEWNGVVKWHNYCMRGMSWCGKGNSTDVNLARIRNRENVWGITRQRLPTTTIQLSGGYNHQGQHPPQRFRHADCRHLTVDLGSLCSILNEL